MNTCRRSLVAAAAGIGGLLLPNLHAQQLSRLELLVKIDAIVEHATADGQIAMLVACNKENASGVRGAAPGWHGATREHPGRIRPMNNPPSAGLRRDLAVARHERRAAAGAARRDATPVDFGWTFTTGC